MDENTIDIKNFHIWKHDPVTKCLFAHLREVKELLLENLLDRRMVLAQNGQIEYSRVSGMIDGIDKVLEIDISDLIGDTQSEHEEEINTGRT